MISFQRRGWCAILLNMFRKLATMVGIAMMWMDGNGIVHGGQIAVPNRSFEAPATTFVTINFDSWQKAPQPDWYVENGGFLWSQLIGAFKNTAATSSDHIDNCDGNQALWLFAIPEVSLFQDYNSVDWNDPAPTHAFDAKFEAGKSYQLTVGVIGGGGGMLEGVALEISLYYRDNADKKVTVAMTSITNKLIDFPTTTHLVDCTVRVPVVRVSDPWAGQRIGIQFLSTVTTNLQGGYWDLDNVRLASQVEPLLQTPVLSSGLFSFTLQSEPGSKFDILTTTNLTLAPTNWTTLATLTNASGTILFEDPVTSGARRFYQAVQRP